MSFQSVLGALAVLVYSLSLHCNVAADGTSYIHWGRTSCGAYARLLYKGYIASPWYNEPGGGSNSICVPEKPDFANTVDGEQQAASLYGTEFELDLPAYSNLFSTINNNKKSLHNYNAVCARCYIPSSTDNFMFPARQDCGEGNSDFNLLYKGYLMSTHKTHSRSEFICMDESPEGTPGSESNVDGNILYPVEVKGACKSSLPCPEYESYHEVTCAVCAN